MFIGRTVEQEGLRKCVQLLYFLLLNLFLRLFCLIVAENLHKFLKIRGVLCNIVKNERDKTCFLGV